MGIIDSNTLGIDSEINNANAVKQMINNLSCKEDNRNIIDYFEEQVLLNPDATAVQFDGKIYTYKEINKMANAIAYKLVKNAVPQKSIIVISMSRSVNIVTSILGILKAGHIFLPIDYTIPVKRIQDIIDDSKAYAVLVNDKDKQINIDINQRISVDETEKMDMNIVSDNNDLAYVLYTSGTTGKPKGVMVKHQGLVNFINWKVKHAKFDRDSVMLQKATCSFDAAVGEIFLALFGGIALQMLTEEQNDDFDMLLDILYKNEVTHMVMVPTVLMGLLDYMNDCNKTNYLSNLKRLYVAGEECTLELLHKYCDTTGHTLSTITNLYGPTEGSICSTYYDFTTFEAVEHCVPIGKALPNINIYIVKEETTLCGTCEEGELWVGGVGVAEGYINNPEQNQKLFISNPFHEGEKVYRTGDLVRQLENGDLQYIGRIDSQIKLNGQRVELGEIKNVILSYAGIDNAAVIPLKLDNKTNSLCAFYICNKKIETTALVAYMGERLPEYMIPVILQKVDKFPHNENGKLDTKALQNCIEYEERLYAASTNEMEDAVIKAMGAALQRDRIGINDNFFQLGGDSIKAIRIVSKLRELGFNSTIQTIMQEKTIKSIAKKLTANVAKNKAEEKVEGEVLLTPIQKQYFGSTLVNPNHFSQTFLLKGSGLNIDKLYNAVKQVVNHHDMLRAVYCDGKQTILPMDQFDLYFERFALDINLNQKEILEQILSVDDKIQNSITLNAPLVKLAVFEGEEESYVLFIIHHLVVDGISWRIILEDLNIAYSQEINGETTKLPDKTTSFKEWSYAIQDYSKSEKLLSELQYWKNVLVHTEKSYLSETHTGKAGFGKTVLYLSDESKEILLNESNRAYGTEINDLMLAALFRAIHKVNGSKNVSVCMEGHGREEIHQQFVIDRTVGWFTTIYPVAVHNIGKSLYQDVIQVKEILKRLPNKGIGYGVIKSHYEDIPENKCDITFNYLGEFDNIVEDYPINIEELEFGNQLEAGNKFGTPITVDGSVLNGNLQFTFQYDKEYCDKDFIEQLKMNFAKQLEKIAAHCYSQEEVVKTPSDYGEFRWSIDELNKVEELFIHENESIERIYPLSAIQQGMLYDYHIGSKNDQTYMVQSVYETIKEIEPNRLRQSINLLSKRYPCLRTMIAYSNVSEPRQVVVNDREPYFEFTDISDQTDKENFFEEQIINDYKKPFDLEEESLIRFKLYKLSDKFYKLVLTFHHIILDGWCTSILLRDMNEFYCKLAKGQSYSELYNTIVSDNLFERHILYKNLIPTKESADYWKSLLEGYEYKVEVRPENIAPIQNEIENSVVRKLSEDSSERLDKLCKEYNVTPNIFFEAAWAILLQKYTNSTDIVFGRVVSGRDLAIDGIEEAIGLFINTIPARVTREKDLTIDKMIQNLQNQSIESSQYDKLSLAEIQNYSGFGGNLFNTIVAFERYGEVSNLKTETLALNHIKTKETVGYPITLNITEGHAYELKILYDVDTYQQTEITQLLKYYYDLVNAVLEDITAKVSDLNFFSVEETNKLLYDFNDTETEYERMKSVIDIFNEVSKEYSERTALSDDSEEITYGELNHRADCICRQIIAKGVQPGDVVGIAAKRKCETVIGILAIIKAGAVYLPMDLNNPLKRTNYIINDSKMKLLISYEMKEADDLNQYSTVEKLYLNRTDDYSEQSNTAQISIQPEDIAYIMYTSGSTGEPKGAMITHRNIVSLVRNTNYADFNDIRILQTGALSFDACTFEIWGAWLNGGCLHLADNEALLNSSRLNQTIREQHINSMFITTALFNQHMSDDVHTFSGLKQLLVGGEKISREPVVSFITNNPEVNFSNIYGPTECTTFAMVQPISDYIPENITIGYPLTNTTAYVISDNKLCGTGMIGELCIGGDGVSSGYLNLPEMTNKVFIRNPYAADEIIYRTGDLVRRLSDGSIEYIGRIDNQIKIRGFRIELNEIVSKLKSLNYVNDAAVKVFTDEEQFICAFIKCDEEKQVPDIMADLKKSLPEYMVPSALEIVKEFPLNKNGKIDLGKLLKPTRNVDINYAEPETEAQKLVAQAFSEVLNTERVGLYDDFFTLNGHSLKAISLAGLIEKKYGIRPSLDQILENRTVEKIARVIESLEVNEKPVTSFAGLRDKKNEMSSAQKRIFMVEEMQEESIVYNIPILLKLIGSIDENLLEKAVNTLCERHEVLRTNFKVENNIMKQCVNEEVHIPLTVVNMDGRSIENQAIELMKPFNLKTDPLIRAYLLRYDNNQTYLFFDIHHIVFDGASIQPFINELSALYNNRPFADMECQYRNYSAWHNSLSLKEQEKYWLGHLSEIELGTDLPMDYVRPQTMTNIGKSLRIDLDTKLTKGILKISKETESTDFMVLISALSLLISRYTRKKNVSIGTVMAGRNRTELENMIGMFVNTVVINSDYKPKESFLAFLEDMKERCMNAHKNQDYPFESIVNQLEIERTSSRNPLFDVMFSIEHHDTGNYNFGDAAAELIDIPNHTAKFDLVLTVKEKDGNYTLCWDYNVSLFKEATIQRMSNHYLALLNSVLEDDKKPLSITSNLSELERNVVMDGFSQGFKKEIPNITIVEKFEKQAAFSPNHAAVALDETVLSYDELNKRANMLARKLQGEGVHQGDMVGLMTNRSIDMIVGIYAILKTGAAYLPIDASVPANRIQYMLKDCEAVVLLSNVVTEFDNYKVLDFEAHGLSDSNLNVSIDVSTTAYVIYTSGTTGNPKGIRVNHKNLVNLMDWQEAEGKLDYNSVVLQKSTYVFDASVWEIFLSTTTGSKLQLISDQDNRDLTRVLEIITKYKVTHTLMVPTVFNYMLDSLEAHNKTHQNKLSLDSLKITYLGAEVVTEELIKKYLRLTGKELSSLRNLYGPTEGTVCATWFDFTNYELGNKIPIGNPIQNGEIYIVDEELMLCGIGMPGEICIGGAGVSGGYINLEKLTAEKFIENPYTGSGYIYKTGDLGVWTPEGDISYLGRIDDQVKIRGFRIELEEIRSTILKAAGVMNAAVIVTQGNNPQILAYVVGDMDTDNVKKSIKGLLPDYMMPSHFMVLDELPTNRNGKLDRKKLPMPSESKTNIKPKTKTERILSEIFEDILGVKEISVDDSFFSLGGHSILATSLVKQVEKSFDKKITLSNIFNNQSICSLANFINKQADKVKSNIMLLKAKEVEFNE